MQSARFFDRSRSNTSASIQDECRNSNAAQVPAGRMPRNASSTARSLRKYGGSWKRIAPSLGPSVAAVRRKYCTRSAQSRSFAMCVMRLGALRVSLNLSGVSRFQPARIFSFGVR